jgi:UDP-N-acetylglucosamine 4,6-dehydratase/5-epimerase
LEGRIFLTGGTGSLGRAILSRAERESWDCEFTVFSRTEAKQNEVRARFPRHHYVLGDVANEQDVQMAMRGHDVAIHAAAYKMVPQAEVNSAAAIGVNVTGSGNIARHAVLAGVQQVIGISTDKACAPVNLYGMTKAVMEKLFQDACNWGGTRFNLVRYGNVLGSTGSVVPLFKRQMGQGYVTITDDRMTRFWLTLDDAVDLVVKASEETEPGTIIVPKAPASSMVSLVLAVAPNAEMRTIGIRPGEKIHEQLIHAGESMHADDIGTHFRIYPAYTGRKGNLPDGFEYRSDLAPQVRVRELREMLVRSGE